MNLSPLTHVIVHNCARSMHGNVSVDPRLLAAVDKATCSNERLKPIVFPPCGIRGRQAGGGTVVWVCFPDLYLIAFTSFIFFSQKGGGLPGFDALVTYPFEVNAIPIKISSAHILVLSLPRKVCKSESSKQNTFESLLLWHHHVYKCTLRVIDRYCNCLNFRNHKGLLWCNNFINSVIFLYFLLLTTIGIERCYSSVPSNPDKTAQIRTENNTAVSEQNIGDQ